MFQKILLKFGFFAGLLPIIAFAGWAIQTSGTNFNLQDVDFVDANHGWVVGGSRNLSPNDAVVLRTENGGNTWINVTPTYLNLGIDGFYSVSAPDSLTCYVTAEDTVGSGSHFYILKTIDGGTTWMVLNAPTYTLPICIYFINSNTGWTAGELDYQPMVLHTENGGNSWSVQGWLDYNGGPCRIFFCDLQTGFVAGGTEDSPTTRGYIMRTTDGGSTWSESYHWGAGIPYTYPLMTGVHFPIDNQNGWACGLLAALPQDYMMRIIHTTNSGESWSIQLQTDSYDWPWDIHFVDLNNGWVVCFGGQIIRTTNGGANWYSEFSGVSNDLMAVDFVDLNNGWAVGSNGIILKYTEGGGVEEITPITNAKKIELILTPATDGCLSFFISSPHSGDINFSIYNVIGQLITSHKINVSRGVSHHNLALPYNLSPGIYFLKAAPAEESITKKFVLIK